MPETSPLYRDAEDVVQMIVPDGLGLHLFATVREAPMPGTTLFAQWREAGLLERDLGLHSLKAAAVPGAIPTPA